MKDRQPRPTLPPLRPRLQSWEETRSLIPEKGPPEDDPDVVVKGGDLSHALWRPPIPTLQGILSSPADPLSLPVLSPGWLYREPRGGGARPWLPPRRAWFVLTRDSLDQFSSSGKGARRLGSLVLTSLCSVTGPERRPKETGETSRGLSYLLGRQPQPALIALRLFSFPQGCGQ